MLHRLLMGNVYFGDNGHHMLVVVYKLSLWQGQCILRKLLNNRKELLGKSMSFRNYLNYAEVFKLERSCERIVKKNKSKKVNFRKMNFNSFCKLVRPYSRGDIFYYNFKKQKGSLQSGVRPVVIIQNDKGNEFSTTTIVGPVTRQYKRSDIPTMWL